jgi:putative beta-barrel porin BBP2
MTSGRRVVAFCAATLGIVSIDRLEAQAPSAPILPSTTIVHAGPASLYPSISLHDVGTDSNVNNDGLAPREDFTYSVMPRLYAVVPIASGRFIATGTGDFVYFQTYKDQQSLNGFFEGRYDLTDGIIRPFATISYATQERQTLEIDERVRLARSTLTVGAEIDVASKTSLMGWVHRERAAWDEDEKYSGVSLAEQLNSTTDIAAAGARIRLTPFTSIVALAEIQRDRFESSPEKDADSVRIAPYVEFDNGAAIFGRARLGYRAFRPVQSGLAGYDGPVSSVALAWRLLDRLRGKVDAGRDVRISYDPLQPFYLETGLLFEVRHRVAGPFELIGQGERWQLHHQRIGGSSFDGRRENTSVIGGGLGIRLREQVELSFTVDRRQRSSSDPLIRNYERQRVLASVTYGLS